MATRITNTNFDPFLKQLYIPSNLNNLTFKKRPLFGMLPKGEDFGGRNMPIPIQYGNPQGRSAAFATAQSNYTAISAEDFLLTRVNDYSVAAIDGETIESTRKDTYSFLQALKAKIDSAMNSLSDAIESFLFRSGTGSMATAGTISTITLTLADTQSIYNFEVGMELVASATDGGSLRTGSATVTGMNRNAGTLTTDTGSNWTTQITSFAAGDYIAVEGDAANGSTNVKISGLAAWCPSSAPSASESFFQVDRSVNDRLYGVYHDGSGSLVEEAAIDAQSKASAMEGHPNTFVMHNAQYRRLVKELGSKKEYSQTSAQDKKGMVAHIGYTGVTIDGDYGPINCVPCNKCPPTTGFMLEMDSWKLHTLGKATKIADTDGNRFLRLATADGYELRCVMRGNLCTNAPCHNANVTLPSTS